MAIVKFIQVTNLFAEKIVVISHDPIKLKLTEKALDKVGIEYRTVLYLGIENISAGSSQQDIKAMKLQKDMLMKGNWIEDDEALEMVKED